MSILSSALLSIATLFGGFVVIALFLSVFIDRDKLDDMDESEQNSAIGGLLILSLILSLGLALLIFVLSINKGRIV